MRLVNRQHMGVSALAFCLQVRERGMLLGTVMKVTIADNIFTSKIFTSKGGSKRG